VNAPDLGQYRLRLSQGFLKEAEQGFALERWRSCVDNSQHATENAGKAVLALFGVIPKTHDPAQQIAQVLRTQSLPSTLGELMEKMLPDLLALGSAEHFLTDYGDEVSYKLPWDLFGKDAASEALQAARRSIEAARGVFKAWRRDES
jgi:HEPN domain-containing protein